MLLLVQIISTFILVYSRAEAPPGYVKPTEVSTKNPKYEYGYNIEDEKGSSHGKLETRDGIYALGRYYVQNADSSHNVQYYADDWGFHPYIQYSSTGPHSKSSTHLLIGVEAVKALASNKFTPPTVEPKQHVTQTINNFNQNRLNNKYSAQVQQVPPAQPEIIIQKQQQQQVQSVIVEQPQEEQPKAQQLIYLQEQTQNHINENFDQNQQIETANLYENSQKNSQDYDEESMYKANLGNFGDRIKFVENNRQSLVSGQDVLNINSATDERNVENVLVSTPKPNIHVNIIETNIEPSAESSLIQEPIVVADLNQKTEITQKSNEEVYSTTSNTIETVSTKSYSVTEPSTVLVTPRPVSTTFLAPITAGIQLEQSHQSLDAEVENQKENYLVEIQKSLPFYLGKFEYVQNPSATGFAQAEVTKSTIANTQEKAEENIELGKTLIAFPEAQSLVQTIESNQQLIKENIVEVDQQQAQGLQQVQQVTTPVVETKTKIIEKPVPVVVEKPIEITKYVDRPYPVQVPVAQPVPYVVDRIVEKVVKQPYPVEVRVPVEIPVQKIVEKPVLNYQLPLPLIQSYIVQVPKLYHYNIPQTLKYPQQQNIYYQNMYTAPKLKEYLPPLPEKLKNNNGYLPPVQDQQQSRKNAYYTIKPDDYIGLLPPKFETNKAPDNSRKFRNARSNFNANNLRLEYGFMPPLIPSLEIDENGNPVDKSERK